MYNLFKTKRGCKVLSVSNNMIIIWVHIPTNNSTGTMLMGLMKCNILQGGSPGLKKIEHHWCRAHSVQRISYNATVYSVQSV